MTNVTKYNHKKNVDMSFKKTVRIWSKSNFKYLKIRTKREEKHIEIYKGAWYFKTKNIYLKSKQDCFVISF